MSATMAAGRKTGVRGWVRDPVGRFSWLKTATLALILLPALLLAVQFATGDLTARPWIQANHFTGLWGIRILLVSLMVTPARQVVDSTKVLMLRRMLGVAAACYLGAHFLFYVGDQNGNLLHVASEIVSRFYLTIGFIALAGLMALAFTSTNGWQRRLGRGWKRLHKTVYVLTALGILHYFFQSKLDVTNATLLRGRVRLADAMAARAAHLAAAPLAVAGIGHPGGPGHGGDGGRLVRVAQPRADRAGAGGEPRFQPRYSCVGVRAGAGPGRDGDRTGPAAVAQKARCERGGGSGGP